MTVQQTQSLTITEQHELERCEIVIQQGLETFIEVGTALMIIRDKRLYRVDFGTFEEYCRERWGVEKSQTYRLIDAAKVVSNLSPIGEVLPRTESQARPLAKLEPELQREAWAEVVRDNGPNITAAKVEEVVDRWKPANDRLLELKEENRPSIFNPAPRPVEALVASAREKVVPRLQVHFTSDTEEWYTPKEIVDAVELFFGAIDLDPCSNSHDSPNVPASNHYTKDDDGLTRPWFGRVYINPPYGRIIQDWTNKAADEYEARNVEAAILLIPARTDTAWMARLKQYPRCFVRGRLKFSNSPDAAPFPSCLVYLGENETGFARAFSSVGDVYKLIDL